MQTLANRPREIWLPLEEVRGAPAGVPGPIGIADLARAGVIGRLKPGVALAAAEAAMQARVESLGMLDDDNALVSARLFALTEYLTRYDAQTMRMLGLGVAFVLLIACAGVANLLLARGAERAKELGIRAAIGAGRARLFRQLLGEALVLGLIGGGAGVLLAWGGVGAVRALVPVDMLRRDLVAVDLRALTFTLAVSVVAGLLFGLLPAWRASRADVRPVLAGTRGGGRERARLRGALIVGEIALALTLVTGAGLTIQSLSRLIAPERLGFDTTNALTLRPVSPLVADVAARARLLEQIETRLGALPGVQSVGVSDTRPLGTSFSYGGFLKPGSDEFLGALQAGVSTGYFDALGIGIANGRAFLPGDRAGAAPVALVSATAAARYWPGESPIGQVVLVPDLAGGGAPVAHELVGVVRNVASAPAARNEEAEPVLYVPYAQTASSTFLEIVLRVAPGLPAAALIAPARAELAAIDRTLSVIEAPTLAEELAFDTAQPRFIAIVLGAFAALALVLTMVGVGGVVAYLVRARAYELGVRLALGATRAEVMRLVMGYGLKLALVGVVLGTAVSVAVTRVLEAYLFQVEPLDAVTMAVAPVVLFLVVLAACWAPSRRILRIDPAAALRHE
jgi:predicted permease